MSSVVIAGDTSGTVTLAAPAVSGTTTLTLPATTGTVVIGTAPSGTIVGTTDTQTLTNKTLTSPTITTPTINSLSSASATALTLQSGGTTGLTIDTSQNLAFNSGYGSVATAYGCRAWVNFNGTSTVAIRASGNVSSITDNGAGDYTVNLTTALADINYAYYVNFSPVYATYFCSGSCINAAGAGITESAPTTSAFRFINNFTTGGIGQDSKYVNVSVFR